MELTSSRLEEEVIPPEGRKLEARTEELTMAGALEVVEADEREMTGPMVLPRRRGAASPLVQASDWKGHPAMAKATRTGRDDTILRTVLTPMVKAQRGRADQVRTNIATPRSQVACRC